VRRLTALAIALAACGSDAVDTGADGADIAVDTGAEGDDVAVDAIGDAGADDVAVDTLGDAGPDVADVAVDTGADDVAVDTGAEGDDVAATATCGALVAPSPVVGVPPAGRSCIEPTPCDPDEVFTPYVDATFDGSGEPGAVGEGFLVSPADWSMGLLDVGPAAGGTEATLEAAFKVGTSAGCLLATDWRSYLALSTSEVIALGYGADPSTLVEARFALDAFPPRAWEPYTDGRWHHIAVTIDTAAGVARFSLDGATSPELEMHAAPIPGLTAPVWLAIGYGCVDWGLDEVRFYDRALPPALLAEHAAAIARGEPYVDRSACGEVPCAAVSEDYLVVAAEYAPVGADGKPTMNALEQLRGPADPDAGHAFPLPRYRAGHQLPRMESWIQGLWLSADNDLVVDANTPESRAVQLPQEMALRWHYYYDLSHLGCQGLDYPICGDAVRSFVEAHPDIPTSFQTYAAGAPVDLGEAGLAHPACPGGLNPLWPGEPFRAAAEAFNDYWLELPREILGRGIDLLVEDGETWWEGRQWGGPPLNESDLATCAEVDPEVAVVFERDYLAKGLGARQMWTDAFTRWRLAYNDGLRALTGQPEMPIQWYGMDGYPSWNAGDWGLGARLAEMSTAPQTFGGEPQRYSGLDFYPPFWSFDVSRGPRHGTDWLAAARGGEIAAGDHLFWPFVAAGWSTENQNIRPGPWLGLLKVLAGWGAVSYHPGYFAYPPHAPGGEWAWQAAMPAYAQAVTSRWESLLRSSVVVEASQRGNPRHLVVVRQERDTAGAFVPRWVVIGNVNRWSNYSGGLYAKDAVVDVRLGDETVRVPIRMQGSVYVYDATVAPPTWVQLDAWHEWTHPSWWSEDFAFEAEVDDGVSGAAPIATEWAEVEGGVREAVVTARQLAPGARVRFAFDAQRAGEVRVWARLAADAPAEVAVEIAGARRAAPVPAGAWRWYEVGSATLAVGPGAVEVEASRGQLRFDALRVVRSDGPTRCDP